MDPRSRRSPSQPHCRWPGTGLSFTIAAEIGGSRSGAAIGIQQTAARRRGRGRSGCVRGSRLRDVVASGVPRCRRVPARRLGHAATARRPRVLRSRACVSSTGSTSSTRSAVVRARTVRTSPLPRTRRIGLRRRGARRRGSRSKSTVTATSSDARRQGDDVWAGSHLDTVPQGGRFDGALGVVAAIEAVERVGAGAVVAFRGEEVGCIGSRARVAAGGAAPGCVPRAARRARPEACGRRCSARGRHVDRGLRTCGALPRRIRRPRGHHTHGRP